MTFSLHAYNDARKVAGPCAAFRAATGRAGAAPLQLFTLPRRRRRRALASLRRAFLASAFIVASALWAGVVTAFLPSPF